MAEEKTNVMRVLEQKKIPYTPHWYPTGGAIDGVSVAAMLKQGPAAVFKTLVTEGASGKNYVFVVPAAAELDLKAAAKAVGEKSVAMIKQARLLPLTGYLHGGCSPIGMKKLFRTVVDTSALERTTIMVSAGRVGAQVELDPNRLAGLIRAEFAPVASV